MTKILTALIALATFAGSVAADAPNADQKALAISIASGSQLGDASVTLGDQG